MIPSNAELHLTKFLRKQVDSLTADNLIPLFLEYLKENFPAQANALIHHEYSPWPYHIITVSDLAEKAVTLLSAYPGKIDVFHPGEAFIRIQDLHFYPVQDHSNLINRIIVFSFAGEMDLDFFLTFCGYIRDLTVNLSRNTARTEENIQTRCTEYMSNLIHDFNSLIAVVSTLSPENESLHRKLLYGKKLSRDVLFYMRNIELSRTRVKVNELIEAILKNYSTDSEIQNTIGSGKESQELSVDVELIDKAIRAILDNAVCGARFVKGKVIIDAMIIKNTSIFVNHDWIKINISNNGPSIPSEFIPHVKDPFFTTWKDQGQTGMGLALAEKIIQAHSGRLIISNTSTSGVEVSVYLPLGPNHAQK